MSISNISDFCISNEPIPVIIADRILKFHLIPLNNTQECVWFDIAVSNKSRKSCYRPFSWEIKKGRTGKSQHTFGQRLSKILNHKGACDITCENFKENKDALLRALIQNTGYLRFSMYATFIHADYKDLHNGKICIFTSNKQSEWTFIKFIE